MTAVEERRDRAQRAADVKLIMALVEARKRKGLTQAEVAARMGTTQQAVSIFENQNSDPVLSTVRRYAGAVGVMVTHTTTYWSDR